MDITPLRNRLEQADQQHLLAFWDELNEDQQSRLRDQIEAIDLAQIRDLVTGHEELPDWAALARRAEPPPAYRLNEPTDPPREQARELGEEAVRAGRVGMILVAGGQGTRLGYDHPKSTFPIGPVSNHSLLQILVERLQAVAARYQVAIPMYVMTSPATHEETLAFLERHQSFGMPEDQLRIFCQGTMPAVDAKTGRILLASKDSLALAPNGHGGMVAALNSSDCLEDAGRRGIDYLFYGQVDNPLLQICDPVTIGFHIAAGSEMTTQVIQKRYPLEKVGNVVLIDGKVQIIEYSDLPPDVAQQQEADGSLRLWAGSIAVHVFNTDFLQRVLQQHDALPLHRALKKTAFIDDRGKRVEPEEPNSHKFERFIFDLLPHAQNAVVVEVDPQEAFAPVKNSNDARVDTPQIAQQMMIALHSGWLRQAGAEVAAGVPVEISPLWALDAQDVAAKIEPGRRITKPTYFR